MSVSFAPWNLGITSYTQLIGAISRGVGCGSYSMAAAERIDVEEGKDLVTLKQLQGRDVPYR